MDPSTRHDSSLVEKVLNPMRELFGYHLNMHAPTVPLGLLYHDGHCCGSWVSQLGRTVGCFLPLEAYRVSSANMKAIPQERGIQISSNSEASALHDVFSIRDLPSTCGHKASALAVDSNVLRVS